MVDTRRADRTEADERIRRIKGAYKAKDRRKMLFLNTVRIAEDSARIERGQYRGRTIERKVLTLETLHVAQTVAGITDPKTLSAEFKYSDIAERCGRSRSEVNRAIARCRALGWLETTTTGRSTIARWARGVLSMPAGETPSDRLNGLGPRIADRSIPAESFKADDHSHGKERAPNASAERALGNYWRALDLESARQPHHRERAPEAPGRAFSRPPRNSVGNARGWLEIQNSLTTTTTTGEAGAPSDGGGGADREKWGGMQAVPLTPDEAAVVRELIELKVWPAAAIEFVKLDIEACRRQARRVRDDLRNKRAWDPRWMRNRVLHDIENRQVIDAVRSVIGPRAQTQFAPHRQPEPLAQRDDSPEAVARRKKLRAEHDAKVKARREFRLHLAGELPDSDSIIEPKPARSTAAAVV